MGRAKHFTANEQAALVLLRERYPNRSVEGLARILGRSVSGCRRRLAKNCAKKKTSCTIKQRRNKVIQLAKAKTSSNGRVVFKHPSCSSIAKALNVSKSTVFRDFKAMGWVCRVRRLVPTVSPDDINRRLRFARKYCRFNPRRILFTDEVLLQTNDNHLCRTQWVQKGSAAEGRLRARWPTGRIMIHGSIGYNVRHLVIFNGAQGETMNGEQYKKKVLHRIVPLCLQHNLVLQQDGARPHIAKKNLTYVDNKGCQRIDDWPARSPQLNVIEQLWPHMHAAIAKRTPSTTDDLIRITKEEWDLIPTSKINSLVDSFRKKCQKCVKQGGKL